MNLPPRVVILGLDGATFENLMPQVLEKGWMPRFSEALESGVYGTLESVYPPVTAPAWASFYTGVNPGKHGVFDFTHPSFGKSGAQMVPGKDLVLYSARDVRAPRLWHMLEASNIRTGVFNLPFTYPAEPLNGIMIPGSMTAGDKAATFPSNVIDDIEAATDTSYFESPIMHGASSTITYLRKLRRSMKEQNKVDQWLLGNFEFDLYCTVYTQTDIFQHIFYHLLDPTHPLYDHSEANEFKLEIQQFYQTLDSAIGQILDRCGATTTFLFISDHGFQPVSVSFNVNEFLKRHGYLVVENGQNRRSWRNRLLRNVRWLGRHAPFDLRAHVSSNFKSRIVQTISDMPQVDYERTQAFLPANSAMGLFLTDLGRRRDGLVDNLIELLADAEHPASGRKVFDAVLRREDVYSGPYVTEGPNILLLPAEQFNLRQWGTGSTLFDKHHHLDRTGNHSIRGLYAAYGAEVKQGGRQMDASILDIAPTVMFRLGAQIPIHLDGWVMTEIFDAGYLAQHEIERVEWSEVDPRSGETEGEIYSDDEAEAVAKRLRDLGYL